MSRSKRDTIEIVRDFCTSNDLERDFESFAEENWRLFDEERLDILFGMICSI